MTTTTLPRTSVVPEAEVVVLGAFLIAGRDHQHELDKAQSLLTAEMFTSPAARRVYAAAVRLRERGTPADVVVLVDELRRAGELEEAGGFDFLASLVDAVPTAAHVAHHAQLVRAAWAERRYKVVLETALRDLHETNAPPLSSQLERLTESVQRLAGDTADPDAEAQVFTVLADLQDRPELLVPPEAVVHGLAFRARLVLLAAAAKDGKTTLAAQAAAALSRGRRFLGHPTVGRTHRTVFVGLEEALGDAVRRFAELDADPTRLHVVVQPVPDLPVRLRRLLTDNPADLVVIDSLTEWARVTNGTVPEDGDSSGWASVMRPLVQLSRDHDVAVVVLHHVRRSDGQYRGSSEIAASADAIREMARGGSGEDPTLRRITGRGRAGLNIQPMTVALRDGRYELDGGVELSLDALVLLHVEAHPDCSRAAVRSAIPRRAASVDAALNRLVERGAIRNSGTRERPSYRARSGQPVLEVI